MVRIYMLSYIDSVDREVMQEFLTYKPEILHWMSPYRGLVFLSSAHNCLYLQEQIRMRFPNIVFYLTECDPNTTMGFGLNSIWDFIKNPAT